jgi:hypothetical protein
LTNKLTASLVLVDLRDALAELDAARGSPKRVRQAFTRFVDLTQKLTSAMRKDFGRIKGGKWDASAFPGWNDVTEFVKWLRNQDQHELPIHISVHERQFYEVPGHPGRLFPFEGTWTLSDQTSEEMPSGITFYAADAKTGAATASVPPVRIEYQYLVQLSSEAIRKRLQQIGTTDMHHLAAACFSVMERYHAYFLERIGA